MTDDSAFPPLDPELAQRAADVRAARDNPRMHPLDVTLVPRRQTVLPRRAAEILTLLADGATNQEIADQLHLGIDTVKSHVKTMLYVLGGRNRTHLVALAYRKRIITLDPDHQDEGEQ